jgi:predicted ATPase/DNA-binding winged helix-turn-helix (wHTH) protein
VEYRFGDFELDEDRFELRRAGEHVAIQPKALRVLFYLVDQRARAVDRDEMLRRLWPDVRVGDDVVFRAICAARRALGDERHEIIATVRGRGFRFVAPLVPLSPATAAGEATLPAFVGREGSVAALAACLAQARKGRGTSAAIAGETGVGKTRLAEELATMGRAGGAQVVMVPVHDSSASPPFAPWIQALASVVPTRGSPLDARAKEARDLLATAHASSGPQFTVFERVTGVLVEAAARQPLVLILDDVHLADEGSLSLVQFFARALRSTHVAFVWTYRDGAVGSDARARALGAALRESGSVPILLSGLTMEETGRLARDLKGVEPPSEFVAALHAKTGGFPVFIRQVLESDWAARALQGFTIATSVDMQNAALASVERYLDRVSPVCREVLSWAAVLDASFEFALLAELTSIDREALLNHLEEAHRAHLVTKRRDGRYTFLVPLVGDVLLKQLGASGRASRHEQAALALESFHREALDAHAARIARHLLRAAPLGTAQKAFTYCVRAATHAERRGDPRAAVKQWEQALRALDLLPSSDTARVQAQLSLARARSRADDARGARQAFLDAATLAHALAEPELLVDAATELAQLGDDEDARSLLARARDFVARTKCERGDELMTKLGMTGRH